MPRLALIALAAAVAAPLPAAAQSLPVEPWPRAVACSAHLFLIIQNAQAKDAPKTAAGGIRVLQAALANWGSAAAAMPEYSRERLGQEIGAYVSGPLGAGEGALPNDLRQANAEVCVTEAVNAELEAREEAEKSR